MSRTIRRVGVIAAALAGLYALGLFLFARFVATPAEVGLHDGALSPCGQAPNCVSTEGPDAAHAMTPVRFRGRPDQAREQILAMLQAEPRIQIEQATPTYIHAVSRSATFGFPDDVEFLIDTTTSTIHFRSAARMGYGDLGVNRRRMQEFSAILAAQLA